MELNTWEMERIYQNRAADRAEGIGVNYDEVASEPACAPHGRGEELKPGMFKSWRECAIMLLTLVALTACSVVSTYCTVLLVRWWK